MQAPIDTCTPATAPNRREWLARLLSQAAPLAAGVAALTLAGCGSAPRRDAGAPPPASVLSDEDARDVTVYAMSLVGTPYRYGGNTPEGGFDCSGLIVHVYSRLSQVRPPRTVAAMQGWGQPVPTRHARAGDLVLFTGTDRKVPAGLATHAGIFVDAERFVHAPSSGGTVRLDALHATYWRPRLLAFRRP